MAGKHSDFDGDAIAELPVQHDAHPGRAERIRRIAEQDPEPFVRASAARSVERMR
jgi:hypothetical protein